MGVGVTERGDRTIEAAGGPAIGNRDFAAVDARNGVGDGTTRESLGLRVTEDRVLIRADRDSWAPSATDAGVYLATSLAAAIEGEDEQESSYVGTIVQIGPLVNRLNHRRAILRRVLELEDTGHDIALAEIRALREWIEELPAEMPDPLQVGQRVTFTSSAGHSMTVDGESYVVLRASDVLAVLEEEL